MKVDWWGSCSSAFRGFVDDNYVDDKPDTNGDGGGGSSGRFKRGMSSCGFVPRSAFDFHRRSVFYSLQAPEREEPRFKEGDREDEGWVCKWRWSLSWREILWS